MPIIIPSKNITTPIQHNAFNNNKIGANDISITNKFLKLEENSADYTIKISRIGDSGNFKVSGEYGDSASVVLTETANYTTAEDIRWSRVSYKTANQTNAYLLKSWWGRYKSLPLPTDAKIVSESDENLGTEIYNVYFGGAITVKYTETLYEGEARITPSSTSSGSAAVVGVSIGNELSSSEREERFGHYSDFTFRADTIPSYNISPYLNDEDTKPNIYSYFYNNIEIVNSDTTNVDERYHTFDLNNVILTDIYDVSAIATTNGAIAANTQYGAGSSTTIVRRRRVNEITLHCEANKRTLELKDPVRESDEENKLTISGDYVINDNTYYEFGYEVSLSKWAKDAIINQYGRGKETVEISARLSEYYNVDGVLRISTSEDGVPMTFSIGDEIVPMRRNEYGVDVPLSKVFRVCGVKTSFNGEAIQTISAQSTNNDLRISPLPDISITGNTLVVRCFDAYKVDVYVDGIKRISVDVENKISEIDLNELNLIEGKHTVFAVAHAYKWLPSANSEILTYTVAPKLPAPQNLRVDQEGYLHASIANPAETTAHIYIDGVVVAKGAADTVFPCNIKTNISAPKRYRIGVRVDRAGDANSRPSDMTYIDYVSYGFLAFAFANFQIGGISCSIGSYSGEIVNIPQVARIFSYDQPVREVGTYGFSSSNILSVYIPPSVVRISGFAFSNCPKLKDIAIPHSVTDIGDGVFAYSSALQNASLGNQLKIIPKTTFKNCTSLAVVKMPKSIQTIGADAFYSCGSLSDIYYEGSKDDWDNIAIESGNEAILNAEIHYNAYIY